MEPKEKKRKKKHDSPREHDGKDAPPDETKHFASEQPQKEASKVKGSSEGHKRNEKSGDDIRSNTQPATEGISKTSGDKKVRKRKKEDQGEKALLKQGDASKETNTPPEPVAHSVDDGTKDEEKIKKRKHKKKREGEEDAGANHGSTIAEAATMLELLASQTDDYKKDKKKKGKEEKAAGEKRKHEDSVANDVG
jgi:hypothetical protein